MKAIRIHGHGQTDVLKIDEIDIPKLQPGYVLVRIKSAGINHLDLFVRKGIPGTPLPIIMGSDAAGIIERIYPDESEKTGLKSGDHVFIIPYVSCKECTFCRSGQDELCSHYHILGEHLDGTQASYISIPVKNILPMPINLNFDQAAAFPLSAMTAYRMLIKKANIKKDQTVFVWGASSGIGSFAIQMAKIYHCQVITTAGNEDKMKFARSLGAEHVLNYTTEDITGKVKNITNGVGVDTVFEHTGSDTFPTSLKILKKGGKIVTCGATTGPRVTFDLRHLFIKHQQIIGSTMGNSGDLKEIARLIEQNKLIPRIGHTFHFSEIQQAHQILEQNKQQGKVVIRFDD